MSNTYKNYDCPAICAVLNALAAFELGASLIAFILLQFGLFDDTILVVGVSVACIFNAVLNFALAKIISLLNEIKSRLGENKTYLKDLEKK